MLDVSYNNLVNIDALTELKNLQVSTCRKKET